MKKKTLYTLIYYAYKIIPLSCAVCFFGKVQARGFSLFQIIRGWLNWAMLSHPGSLDPRSQFTWF